MKIYLVPKSHEAVLNKEAERLFQLGVLAKLNISEWGSPTFIQPKNNLMVRQLSNFRKPNHRI